MPNYQFNCPNKDCKNNKNTVILNLKISEYDNADKSCPICGNILERTIESLVCGYQNDKDFYGKTSC